MRNFRFWHFNADPSDPDLTGGGGLTDDSTSLSNENSEVKSPWPKDWVQQYAGDDETKRNIMSRYPSIPAALDGLIASQQKIRSGEYKSTAPFPTEGTEEEQKRWREHNGIPESPDKYQFEGDFGDEDKAFLESWRAHAHESNIPQPHAQKMIDFLLKQDEADAEADRQADLQAVQQASDQLHHEWGGNFRRNMNLINQFLDTGGPGMAETLLKSRLPDGKPLTSNTQLMKFLINKALEINPTATVVPGDGANIASTVDDELDNIRKMMQNEPSKYWKDEKMQQRYRQLLEYKERNPSK